MNKFTLITLDGDTLEVELQPRGGVDIKLFDITRSDETEFTAIRLSPQATLRLRDELWENLD